MYGSELAQEVSVYIESRIEGASKSVLEVD